VGYQNQHLEEETVQKVLEKFKEHNIDVNTLVEWPANHRHLAESPKVEGVRIGTQPFKIFNIVYN
jgi:hypothetical protein